VSTRTIKKLLLSVIAVGVIGSVTARSTYALLNSKDSNANTTIQSGTLTFSNTVNAGTACVSQNGTVNVNTACDVLLSAASLWAPISSSTPASTEYSTSKLTIADTGSLPASSLSLYMPSCTASQTAGSPSAGGTNPCCPGGTFPCATGSLDFYIQETDATWTATKCWWPTVANGACSFTDDSLGSFYSSYHANTTYYSLGTGPAAMGTRYFQIVLAEPVDAGNGLQAEAANFTLHWHMDS
jgi:hypothetical protein